MTKKAVKKSAKKTAPKKAKAITVDRGNGKTETFIDRAPDLSAPQPTIGLTHAQLYRSPLNPRTVRDREEDAALLESIKQHGVQVPLMARPRGGRWEIVMGNRRHEMVGVAIKEGVFPKDYELRVVERDCTDDELIELGGVENMGRKDMHPLDEANLIAHMRKRYKGQTNGAELDTFVAKRLGIKERTLYRRVALLRLATPLQEELRKGKIDLQQAVAYALGTEKTQLTHREACKQRPHLASASEIRDAMTEKRAKVEAALFDAKLYTGEILTDADTGQRYFANMAMFKELQEKAIKEKVKKLKAKHGKVVKVADEYEFEDKYDPCGPRDKGALAVYWFNDDGTFDFQAPVKEVDEDEIYSPDRKRTPQQIKKDNEHQARQDAHNKLTLKNQAALVADPLLTFRAAVACGINGLYVDPEADFGHGDVEDRTAGMQLKLLLPFLGDLYNARNIMALAKVLEETRHKPDGLTLAFAAVRDLKLEDLAIIVTAIELDTVSMDLIDRDKPELSPFGMVVLQRDLPLQAAAESAA